MDTQATTASPEWVQTKTRLLQAALTEVLVRDPPKGIKTWPLRATPTKRLVRDPLKAKGIGTRTLQLAPTKTWPRIPPATYVLPGTLRRTPRCSLARNLDRPARL